MQYQCSQTQTNKLTERWLQKGTSLDIFLKDSLFLRLAKIYFLAKQGNLVNCSLAIK